MALDNVQIIEIEQLAEGLSSKEILEYLNIDYSGLEFEDKEQFDRAVKRGRHRLKIDAVEALKQHMKGKEGLRASLSVLERFAEDWPAESVGSEGGTGRRLVISLDE